MFFKGIFGRIGLVAATSVTLATNSLSGQSTSEIVGTVVDEMSGNPIYGAQVAIDGTAATTLTDGSGRFLLSGLPLGPNPLTVKAVGYEMNTVWVTLQHGLTGDVSIKLRRQDIVLDDITITGFRGSDPSVFEIDAVSIDNSNATDLGELLEDVPGVQVLRRGGAGGSGGPAHVSIRGSNPNQVLVVLDGVVMNSPITGVADVAAMSIRGVEKIEVYREARGDRFGAGALGGAIVIRTGSSANTARVRSALGSWGHRNMSVDGSRNFALAPGSNLSAAVKGDWQTYEGTFAFLQTDVRGGGFDVRRNADFVRKSFAANARLDARGVSLGGNVSSDAVARGMPGSIVQPSVFARQSEDRNAAGARFGLRSPVLDISIAANLNQSFVHFQDSNPPLGISYDERTEVNGWSLSSSNSLQAVGATILVGAELDRRRIRSTMLAPDAPDYQNSFGVWTSVSVSVRASESWTFRFAPSLRADRHSQVAGAVLSPRVQLSLDGGEVSISTSIANGFSPPTFADQFFQEGVLAQPNPDLKPERVRGELTLSVRSDIDILGWNLHTSAGVSSSRVDGMILWFPNHLFVWRPSNVDVSRKTGEISLAANSPAGDRLIDAGFEITSVRFSGGVLEGQVPFRPKWTAHLRMMSHAFGVPVTIKSSFVGTRSTVIGSDANSLKPYWWVDAWAEKRFVAGAVAGSVMAKVVNVLDASLAMFPDYPMPGRGLQIGVHFEPRSQDR